MKNRIVQIIQAEIEKFIKDWQQSPYCWNTEVDIQAEIVHRLSNVFGTHKILEQKAFYKVMNGESKEWVVYRRVSCEWPTYYYCSKKNKKVRRKPDIVVYDDLKDPENPPSNKDGVNDPMFWVCEIKYKTDWGGDQHKSNREYDIKKLKGLLRQCGNSKIEGTKYACFLDFDRTRKGVLSVSSKHKNLKIYKIMLPERSDR